MTTRLLQQLEDSWSNLWRQKDGRAGVGPFIPSGFIALMRSFHIRLHDRRARGGRNDLRSESHCLQFQSHGHRKPAGGTDYRHLWVRAGSKDALNLAGGTPPAPNSGELFTITGQARRERNPGRSSRTFASKSRAIQSTNSKLVMTGIHHQ